MMTASFQKVQWLGMIFSLIILVTVVFLVRERLIKERYSLVWLMIGTFVFVMSAFQGLLEGFSALIGVDYAPSAFFALLMSMAYLLLLNLSVTISGLKAQNKAVTQELGLLRLRVEELEQERKRDRPC